MVNLSIAFLYFFVVIDISLNIVLIALEHRKQKAKKDEAKDNETKKE